MARRKTPGGLEGGSEGGLEKDRTGPGGETALA